MRRVEIFYFSATGNSLTVAKDIAKGLQAKLVSVVSLFDQKHIQTNAKIIGLVFPIYESKAPGIINEFISKIDDINSKYVFAVCTYGVRPLKSLRKLDTLITQSGGTLAGGFTVKMPHNGLGIKKISQKKQGNMFADWNQKCGQIIDYVTQGKQGEIETGSRVQIVFFFAIMLRNLPSLLPLLKIAITKGWDSIGFYADDNCNLCGICEQICPVNNITLEEEPVWSDHCLNCFACLHWCPEEAIQIASLTKKMKRYHHPQVKRMEIMNQKKKVK